MSKNAYEIRQELLYLARDIVRDRKEKRFSLLMENNRIREKNGGELVEINVSDVIPTEEDFFEVAEKLNRFVSKRS